MQIKSAFSNLMIKALTESLDVRSMTKIADRLIPNYNIYKRTGFPENIPIQKQDAAKQIVKDIIASNLLLEFVNQLIYYHTEGYMGKKYRINHLKAIIMEIEDHGLIYDQVNRMFVEDPDVRRARNWGTLREGEDYIFAFLRLDIVGNTKLVQQYPENLIKQTYSDLRGIVQRCIDKRNGRIWNWEGDGGLVAFYFSNKNFYATLSGMEIIHDLFIYNQVKCPLDKPVSARLAIHGGPCAYCSNEEDLKKIDLIKKLIEIESKYTKPNSLTISNVIKTSLDPQLSMHFLPVEGAGSNEHYNYQLRWE